MEKIYILFEDNEYDNLHGRGPKLISVHKTRDSAERAQAQRWHGEINFIKEYNIKK